MDLNDVFNNQGEWLRAEGPLHHIVISSRVRLARNLRDIPFIPRMEEEERNAVIHLVRDAFAAAPAARGLSYLPIDDMGRLDRALLHERHLISREQMEGNGARGLAVDADEALSVMLNEEDHLRLQSIRSGLQIQEAYAAVDRLDDELAATLDYAYDGELGYLTACPTNVGTGMRVSVMTHLPALVMTGHIEKAFRAVHDLRLAVRGFYGEGTEALGEFYQISNQITLGRAEGEILGDLQAVIDSLVSYETKARQRLLSKDHALLEDRVCRAYAILRSARMMTTEEAMTHLSSLRLGVHLALLPDLDIATLNRLCLFVQPAHLQRMEGRQGGAEERDFARARYLRRTLGSGDDA